MRVKYVEQCVSNDDTVDLPDIPIELQKEFRADKNMVVVSWFEMVEA